MTKINKSGNQRQAYSDSDESSCAQNENFYKD